MSETKAAKPAVVAAPFHRFSPEEILRNKAGRDDRRKAIRAQNARSKSLK